VQRRFRPFIPSNTHGKMRPWLTLGNQANASRRAATRTPIDPRAFGLASAAYAVGETLPECFTVRHDDFGDYAPGRWAWLLRDIKPLNPPIDERPPRVSRSPAGMVSASMTTPGRLSCVVPFCRRTTAHADFDEWICGDHWRLIDKVRRQVCGRYLRRWRRYGAAAYGPAAARIWRGLVERAAGIR
jgi:hypothetical protein